MTNVLQEYESLMGASMETLSALKGQWLVNRSKPATASEAARANELATVHRDQLMAEWEQRKTNG
jgi:hypothetical protein